MEGIGKRQGEVYLREGGKGGQGHSLGLALCSWIVPWFMLAFHPSPIARRVSQEAQPTNQHKGTATNTTCHELMGLKFLQAAPLPLPPIAQAQTRERLAWAACHSDPDGQETFQDMHQHAPRSRKRHTHTGTRYTCTPMCTGVHVFADHSQLSQRPRVVVQLAAVGAAAQLHHLPPTGRRKSSQHACSDQLLL
jgi:hypothetical protein